MDRVNEILQLVLALLMLLYQGFDYWLDGKMIELYASDVYRQEAVDLMKEDSALDTGYDSEAWEYYEQRDFLGLSGVIDTSQEAVEAGATPLALWRDMSVFYLEEEGKKKLLNDWVEREPYNWITYAARAEFLIGEGLRSRGTKFVKDTAAEQFAGMRTNFAAAERDLKEAVVLKPDVSRHYYNYFKLARHGAGEFLEADIMKMASDHDLDGYYLRYLYMKTLEPKWGGSFWAMRSFALKSQSRREQDPRVYQLLGYEYQIRAEYAKRDEDWESCVEQYTKAFEYGDLYNWRYGRAGCNEALKRWDDMIPDLEDVAAKRNDYRSYHRIAKAHAKMNQYSQALASMEIAIAIEPESAVLSNYVAWLHGTMDNDDLALQAFERSLLIQPDNIYAAERAARIHLSRRERAAALPYLKISLGGDETNARKWLLYADVLNELDHPEYRSALEEFLEIVDRGDPKWAEQIEMVEAHLSGRGEFE